MGRKITRKSTQSPKKEKTVLNDKEKGKSLSRKNSSVKSKKREIITLSDSENEIDALLEEFKEEEMNFLKARQQTSVVLDDEDDEEMENLLEEYVEQHSTEAKHSSKEDV